MASITILFISISLNLMTFMTNAFVFERQLEITHRILHIQSRYEEISCAEFTAMAHVRDPYAESIECVF